MNLKSLTRRVRAVEVSHGDYRRKLREIAELFEDPEFRKGWEDVCRDLDPPEEDNSEQV